MAASSDDKESDEHHGANRRLLIVEDDEDTGEALRQLLLLFGYQALAVSPDRAEAAMDQFEPEGVLLHLGHPNHPWLPLVGKMRASNPKVAIVGVTGWGEGEFRKEADELGLVAVLTKPISPRDLLAALNRMPGPT